MQTEARLSYYYLFQSGFLSFNIIYIHCSTKNAFMNIVSQKNVPGQHDYLLKEDNKTVLKFIRTIKQSGNESLGATKVFAKAELKNMI